MKIKFADYYPMAFIFMLALGLRIAYFESTVVDTPVRGDAIYYIQYAKNLLGHFTFSLDLTSTIPVPDSYWGPGYPVFLASCILTGDILSLDHYAVIMYAQAFMGAATAVITFLIARLFMGLNWSLLPGVLVALSPHMVSLGATLISETLYTLLLQISIYIFLLAFHTRSRLQYSVSGVLFGLTFLVKPDMFFLPIFFFSVALVLYLYRNREPLRSILRGLMLYLLMFFMIVGVWQIRGALNVPSDVQSSSGRLLTNLIIGSHSNFFDIWRVNPRDENNPATLDEKMLGGSYPAFINLLSDRIIQDPGHYAKWYLLEKPVLLWSWNIQFGYGDIYVYPVLQSLYQKSHLAILTYSIMKSLHYWLLGFAVCGVFVLFNRRIPDQSTVPVFLYIVLISCSLVYITTQAEPRYSVPLRPESYLCAVYFLSKISEYIKHRKLN